MALIVCPLCVREDDVYLVGTLPDGRKQAECRDCNFQFVYGAPTPEAKPAVKRSTSRKAAKAAVPARPIEYVAPQFPRAADIHPGVLEHIAALRKTFLRKPYEADPVVERHWAKFGWVFSTAGLEKSTISDLKLFADDPTGVGTGDPTEFDKAWVLLGELEGARRVRAMTDHLLRGPGALEDRMSSLVDGDFAMTMPGWGEALLSKTLAVAEPDRFLPIVTYEEKRAIAHALSGVELPPAEPTSWTLGRLAVWTNDFLLELCGDDFADLHHAARFLRWAEDQS